MLSPHAKFLQKYEALKKVVITSRTTTNAQIKRLIDSEISASIYPSNWDINKIPGSTLRDEDGYTLIYCDGTCFKNGQPDAIASVGIYFSDYSFLKYATLPELPLVANNIAEIYAAILALRILQLVKINKVHLISDSMYLVDNFNKYVSR